MTSAVQSKGLTVQPFVQYNETYDVLVVNAEEFNWVLKSFLDALDVVFKIVFLLNLEYMQLCDPFFEFMADLIYGIPPTKDYGAVNTMLHKFAKCETAPLAEAEKLPEAEKEEPSDVNVNVDTEIK